MKFSEEQSSATVVIRRFEGTSVVINNEQYSTTVLITATEIKPNWGPAHFSELNDAHLADILAMQPEIVLLGSGAKIQFLSALQLYPFSRAGIGVECMDTAAACRTFNLLAHEGRKIVSVLFLD